jgi:lipopolysaccharide/colanic/teichoic acid biosynthesis glycosyltransferase
MGVADRGWDAAAVTGADEATGVADARHATGARLVKPGMTGLWQVSGRSGLSWEDAVRFDLYNVGHWLPTMDITIIKTFSAVLRGAGAY